MQVLMEYRDRNQGRKRKRKWDAEGQGRAKTAQRRGQNHFWEQYRERLVETRFVPLSLFAPSCCYLNAPSHKSPSSVTHFDERGAPLAPLNFSVSISGEQRHFPGGAMAHSTMGSSARLTSSSSIRNWTYRTRTEPLRAQMRRNGHPRAVLLLCKDVLPAFAPTTVTVAALDGLSPRCARSACAALMCQTRRSLWTVYNTRW
ncbi:hypothetical protein EDB85DRAFT_773013 [Lactarius pseudohatsudake]|nr:hypothetical protein EDB85DRAFT_773013 [Lactarius pseudohatsudake]